LGRLSKDGQAAIYLSATGADVAGNGAAVGPQRPAGPGIERGGVAGRLGNVHHAVRDQGRSFEWVEVVGLILPDWFQTADMGGGGLFGRGGALGLVGMLGRA